MIGEDRIWLEDEGRFELIDNTGRFEDLLECKIGHDAAEYFRRNSVSDDDDDDEYKECHGECDKVYETQEYYEDAIRNALEIIDIRLNRKKKNKKYKNDMTDVDYFYIIEEILKGVL